MFQKIIIPILCIILISSCSNTINTNDRFFIPKHSLDKGIVNKYYITIYPNDQSDKKTTIEYRYLKKINDSIFSQQFFNPAFKLKATKQFMLQNQNLIELNYEEFYTRDTLRAIYPEDKAIKRYLSFNRDTVNYQAILNNKDSMSIQIRQSAFLSTDTLVEFKPAKIIERSVITKIFVDNTLRNTSDYDTRDIYVQDIGLWKSTTTRDTYTQEKLLMEQISPKIFDSISNHNIKNVGAINFDKTIDRDVQISLCSSYNQIMEYYNGGNDRGGFIGGKGNLKRFINNKLDFNKLNNESGYLTFRFVITCNGQAGKFVTNQADFFYNEKQFSEETVTHLYSILASVEKWKPCIVKNNARDSYFYVTFILKNGQIEDIVP